MNEKHHAKEAEQIVPLAIRYHTKSPYIFTNSPIFLPSSPISSPTRPLYKNIATNWFTNSPYFLKKRPFVKRVESHICEKG